MKEHPLIVAADLRDVYEPALVLHGQTVFPGRVWDIHEEKVELSSGAVVTRQVIAHPGAVAICALRGSPGAEEMLIIWQYRQPVRAREWELPAGLLDNPGEPLLQTAQRELWEETDMRAQNWSVLADYAPSPGGMNEFVRIFLARDCELVPPEERFSRFDEEADMLIRWAAVDDVLHAFSAGKLHNSALILAALSVDRQRNTGWQELLSVNHPWPMHERSLGR